MVCELFESLLHLSGSLYNLTQRTKLCTPLPFLVAFANAHFSLSIYFSSLNCLVPFSTLAPPQSLAPPLPDGSCHHGLVLKLLSPSDFSLKDASTVLQERFALEATALGFLVLFSSAGK